MTTTSSRPVLFLRKREERRVRAGHAWVFSNEIDTDRAPLKGIAPGSEVLLKGSKGQLLGTAYCNPASLIACRLLKTSTVGKRVIRCYDERLPSRFRSTDLGEHLFIWAGRF